MIHYHGMPMWPSEAMIRAMRAKHAMVCFANPEQTEVAAEVCQSWAGDCGAFVEWQKGRKVDIEAYYAWVCKWRYHPGADWFVIPDIIDGSVADNDALIAAWDLPRSMSVPVYHLHEPPERFGDLVREYPRVGIGSSGEFKDPGSDRYWSRMAEILPHGCNAKGQPLAKLHGFRQLDPVIFSHVPFSSADSCNAAVNIGVDSRWEGPYVPRSRDVRAIVIMDRVESHASATRWNAKSAGVQQNMELLG